MNSSLKYVIKNFIQLQVIELHLIHSELFQRVGITLPKGCLLYGPPGTGKILLARAVASQLDANLLKVVMYNSIDSVIIVNHYSDVIIACDYHE